MSVGSVRRLVVYVILIAAGYFAWQTPTVRNMVENSLQSGDFLTLEARYSAQDIMEANHERLLGLDGTRSFQQPRVQYHPYILLDVKYSMDGKITEEGVVLWGLNDAEMVLDTASWKRTHGFEDCLNASATRDDYKIVNALAYNKGRMDRETLLKKLSVEPKQLDGWLKSTKKKNLIVQDGNHYRLHFQSPLLQVKPQTNLAQRLVTKPYKHAKRISRRYSRSDIERNAQAAFGAHFAVRGQREVYLPVVQIDVENPDGSIASTYWNALNGQQIQYIDMQ